MSEQIQVSTVTSALDTVPRDYDARRVIETIRTGGKELRGRVELIRETSQRELAIHGDAKRAKVAAAELKKQLPAVLWSGRFTKRANDALLQHSGLLCADLDSLNGSLADVRVKLSESPHLWALFTSPSGDGLKAVFRVHPDAGKHLGSYRAIEQHVRELTGVQVDQACTDVARLCFLSYDPELIYKEGAKEIEPLPEPEKPRPAYNGMVILSERQRIATELLREIGWESETSGFVVCPGKQLHTSGDNERDCELHVDNVPTLHCFHNSCRGILDGVNHELRSRIGKAEYKPDSVSSHTPTTGDHQSGNADDETIRLLAALSPLEYDRQRKTEAERLGCQLSTLDKLVEAKRPASNASGLQGSAVLCPDVEPWPEPVDGAAVLNEAAERIASYVALPEGAADLLALWCTHSHCFQSFECSPRLNITSPERGCGKTTLRDVVALFVPRPLCLENLTSAGAIRLAEQYAPVIMADEYDAWLKDNEELRGLLNAGHRKGGVVVRCQGDNNEPRLFRVYTPAVLCGIGTLPGTLHDRSIVIRLERAKPGELSARFDSRRTGKEKELNRKLSRFCADNRELLQTIDPQLPEGVFNRMADNWRPLFAIAEAAGGDWLKRCAEALGKLIIKSDETETRRVQLLADIRQGLKETGVERIFSRDLIEYLEALTERPWGEVNRGKPINERWLARNLAAFGIHSKTLRIGAEQKKGYELADFGDAFARYLPTPGDSIRPTVPHEGKSDFPNRPNAEAGTDAKTPVYEGMGRWDACEGGVVLEQKNDGLIEEAQGLFNAVPRDSLADECPKIEHIFSTSNN